MIRPVYQVPYKIKEVELEFDNYSQVPESPIGREEEPHLYMVPKKYRKVPSYRFGVFMFSTEAPLTLFYPPGHHQILQTGTGGLRL